jgi:TetR/AcrR family tetracycline transcriptional repressor
MAVTRQEAVAAAIRVLDEAGLEGVSLRRVAAELGVSAPTLYWHVRDKRELLDLVAEAIVTEGGPQQARPAKGQPWWEWLAGRAVAEYHSLLAHRDGARVVAGNRPTPEAWEDIEAHLGALAEAGIPPIEALRMQFVIGAYVIGSALERQAEEARRREGPDPRPPGGWDPDRLPHLAGVARAMKAGHEADPRDAEAVFRYGLDRLLDGLRAGLAERVAARVAE